MFLTFVLAVLAALGLFSIAQWLLRSISLRLREEDVFHVVRLRSDASKVEQTVKSCLRLQENQDLPGRLVFVDAGLTPEAQIAAELLLREGENAVLCGESQLCEMIKWEREDLGAGTD